MPLAKNLTALEMAIYECASAGCESIWITCDDDWMPLLKGRIGDFVYDPAWYYRSFDTNPIESRKAIPIFFVPHFPRYLGRRDSLGWGVMNSAIYAHKATLSLSKFLTPDIFYGCFIFGMHDPSKLISERKKISSKNRFVLRHNDLTVKDNLRLSFTFCYNDVKKVSAFLEKEGTKTYTQVGDFVAGKPNQWLKRLPRDKQNSAKNFDLSKVFSTLDFESACFFDTEWYNDISTWEGYRDFLSRVEPFKRPIVLKREKLNRLKSEEDEL
jgi:hypothetical protein